MSSIVAQNQPFFNKFPKIRETLKVVPKPSKGYWYDVQYNDDSLWLFEKSFNKITGKEVYTDRIIMIDNNGKLNDTRAVEKTLNKNQLLNLKGGIND